MTSSPTPQTTQAETTRIPLSDEERPREAALRAKFASFWAESTGEPRAIYDRFIAATPLVPGVTLEEIREPDMRGWWVHPARTAAAARAILYLHGGGYVQGSAEAYRGFVSQIVSRTDVPALVIDYPLAPESTLPAAPAAALAAWRWLVGQGFQQIAIIGDSAGGGLTLTTLLNLTHDPAGPAPVAAVVFSPWTDLAFTGASMTDPAVEDPLIGSEYLQDCAHKYLGGRDATDPLASPLFGDLQGLPPLLIQVGTDELLLDDSRQFAHRAAQSGVSIHFEIYEGMHHVFQLDVDCLETSRTALDRVARFLHHVLAATSTAE